MHNNILLVQNAGFGATPEFPAALFMPGAVVRVRRLKHLRHLPDRAGVAVMVPPGFPPEYALADATGRPRPLMVTRETRGVRYIVAFDGDPKPYLLREQDLLPTDEEPVPVQWAAPPPRAPEGT